MNCCFFWGGVWHCGREQCSSCLALNLEQHFCHFVSRDIDPSPRSWTEKRRKGMHDLKFGTVRLKMCLATPATQRVGSHLGNTATTSLSITANRQKDKSIFDFMWFFFLSLCAFTQLPTTFQDCNHKPPERMCNWQ